MNPFMFSHVPFALSRMQPSGVSSFLGNSPQTQQRLQQIQSNPFMSTTGTTVPQNTWTGNQFNMPALPTPTTPAPTPAPTPVSPAPGTAGNFYSPDMFRPIGLLQGGKMYPKPNQPSPDGYTWNEWLGYYEPTQAYLQEKYRYREEGE